MSFTIGTLDYSVEMIPVWLGISFGMHIYLRMIKALLATVPSDEFSTMTLNSKISKVVSYIQDKKAWERIYVLLKIIRKLGIGSMFY